MKKYGLLLLKPNKDMTEPWAHILVDSIRPYTVKAANKTFTLLCLTMIDLTTQWVEIAHVHDAKAETAALTFDQVWLSQYP